MIVDDVFIDRLISCPKYIVECPKELKDERGYLKKSFTLSSIDGLYSFSGFIRKSKHFQENFSIGLSFNPKDEKGTVIILRCNGVHGRTLVNPHHATCHIHKVSADDWNNGIKVERNITSATSYVTFEEAIQYFVQIIGLNKKDSEKHFPDPRINMGLFGDYE